ncbi:MAG: DEAD/DEAH box helicase family protein [Cytophagales bacterium]|nr:DEAD/DEAH box helicase family protein [Cytophagales bacterium]
MSLREIKWELEYSHEDTPPKEFFLKALQTSDALDLCLGYFSSSGIRSLAHGFASFIRRGGKVRIVLNDVLSEKDKRAIQEAGTLNEKEVAQRVEENLLQDIKKLREALSQEGEHFYNCFTYLIVHGRLSIKCIVPKYGKGIAHEKWGVFTDVNEDKVLFTGSMNFSRAGLEENIETISCFYSWDQGNDLKHTEQRKKRFEDYWEDKASSVKQIPVKYARVREYLEEYFPNHSQSDLEANERNILSKEETKDRAKVDLRDYQKEAIKNWFDNDSKGILAMATGTGKTYTALSAAQRLYDERERLVILITCPYQHLVDQWVEEAKKFGFNRVQRVGSMEPKWEENLESTIKLFSAKKIDLIVVSAVNDSFASEKFQRILSEKDVWKNTLLISDECHSIGSASGRKNLNESIAYRLGLSATPKRYFDEGGTNAIMDFFSGVVYEYPLAKAIENGYLTKYSYHPILIELTEDEFEEYRQLTKIISKLSSQTKENPRNGDKNSDDKREQLDRLLIKRAKIRKSAQGKLDWLKNQDFKQDGFTIFYLDDQIFGEANKIIGNKMQPTHRFTATESPSERKDLLKKFGDGQYKALVAMKCLDEGVDIPPARRAYVMASSGNKKEFIQRRGRLLRRSKGKKSAEIHDLVVIPPQNLRTYPDYQDASRKLFEPEYKRAKEYAELATNHHQALANLEREMKDLL